MRAEQRERERERGNIVWVGRGREGEDEGGVRVDAKQILRGFFLQEGLSDTFFGSEEVLDFF